MSNYRNPARESQKVMRVVIFLVVVLVLWAAEASAQDNAKCLECHGVTKLSMERDGRTVSLHVDAERFGTSVHKAFDCIACHTDLDGVEDYPHAKGLARVDCTECHDDEEGPITAYRESTHGKKAAEGNALAPLCQDCHGNHYVLKLKDPNSSISPFNVPGMCAQCHAEGAAVERAYDIPEEQVFQRYKDSIHGEGLYKQGLSVTAVCTSCHTGHNVLPHGDPKSTIHKDNVVATCEKCHGQIEQVHRKVIGGELWEKEGMVPLCVECHSPHEVRKVFYNTNMANADCLRCHSAQDIKATSDGRSLFVDTAEHERSIHGRKSVSCAQCHTGATPSLERSCATITSKVDCSVCHEAPSVDYKRGRHGALHAAGDANAPMCIDCHGKHGILESSIAEDATSELKDLVRTSPTYSRNVPELCARCHRDGAPAAQRYMGPETGIIEKYSVSIHGQGLIQSGLVVTAVCTDCHTPHKELPSNDPESTVHPGNIAKTCGQCHDGIYEQFQQSVHSKTGNPDYVQLRDMPPLPECNDCHSSHTMTRTDGAAFKLGVMEQCGKCHDDITESYFETYHGKATALGDTTRAKCYDCHGAHDIRGRDDPKSHLSKANIVGTCGKCHEDSHEQFAGFLTHATHRDKERYPTLYWVFVSMTVLLVGTFAFFWLHTAIWLPRSWKLRDVYRQHVAKAEGEKHFARFTPYQRALHLTVILSFFGLAITGMMLKFSNTQWAHAVSNIFGGIDGAGWVHRVCAIATFGYMGAHVWDVFTRFRKTKKSVKEFFFGEDSLMPKWSDAKELVATIKWFLGRGPAPRYGRWTYWEKFDYLAVFWGVVVIGTTGLSLWFPEFFTLFLPGWSINVATIIHSDEALLATGFIFTIHFFNTHFRPEKFPMDPVIFTGSMGLSELQHDRPALYDRLVATGELEQHLVPPPTAALSKAARVFGLTALVVGLSLAVLIAWAMIAAI
ncbi:MAG: hypothetical protein IT453_19760 [Planctomycetes bacterium]|nr:hypothetical protein [Planctomycetota bacterium]